MQEGAGGGALAQMEKVGVDDSLPPPSLSLTHTRTHTHRASEREEREFGRWQCV